MKILIVDDSEAAREPLRLHLRKYGHDTAVADNGAEALDLFQNDRFDLIITDIRMPKMNGLELLGAIKSRHPNQDVIIITGYGDMDSSLEALRQGASNYLMKPINLDELILAVDNVAHKQALTRKLRKQEAKLNQARKMADLGLVAAGVAHEINNPNTYLRGNVQTLLKFWEVIDPFLRRTMADAKTPLSKLEFILDEMPRVLDAMLDGTSRIMKIVENTATFTARDPGGNQDAVDLNECITRALGLASRLLEKVTLNINLEENLPHVRGMEDGLIDVVSELLKTVSKRPKK